MARIVPVLFALLCATELIAADATEKALPAKLPLSGAPPAKLYPDICLLHYAISTASPKCQAFFDQGLAFHYSYDYGDAARAFETAAHFDPECALSWWGLARALERSNKRDPAQQALEKARLKLTQASHREQFLIKASLQTKGAIAPADAQRPGAVRIIDEMLSFYDDDEEAWVFRAQLAGGGVAAVPFYKALLRINPLHPCNHELVHFYEGRPALAWAYAENYVKGSPGIPHAYHMQAAHHAMRLGRWDRAIECFTRESEVSRQIGRGHGDVNSLMIALTHEGRFAEARKLGLAKSSLNWFTLHLAERNWKDAHTALEELRRDDKQPINYLTALFQLRQDHPEEAAPAVEVMRQALAVLDAKNPKQDRRQLEHRLWDADGQLLCQLGKADAGLALLANVAKRTMGSYQTHDSGHSLNHASYFMESWGIAALKSGKDETAEEAFLEALAHDKGSARGALGMQVLCERNGRADEAARFRDLARRCWQKADAGVLDAELAYMRESYPVYRNGKEPRPAPPK